MHSTLSFPCSTRILSLLILSFIFLGAKAQNLVPNPSFEDYSVCPVGPGQLTDVTYWATPDSASPDYYNVCYAPFIPLPFIPSMDVPGNIQGWQHARTGDGYAGIISHDQSLFTADYREYVKVQLTQPLVAGQQYCVEFYWSLANKSPYFVGEIGAYFSVNDFFLPTSTTLPFTPQVSITATPMNDTVNWVLFQQNFVATGGERYVTIGNFNNPANTTSDTTGVPVNLFGTAGAFAYYYLDDVFVGAECSSCALQVDIDLDVDCDDPSNVTVTAQATGASGNETYQWSNGATTASVTGLSSGIYTVAVVDGVCQGLQAVTIEQFEPVVAQVSANDTICKGESLVLSAGGGDSYLWSSGEVASTDTVSPSQPTTYSVLVTGDGGCQDSAQVSVMVYAVSTSSIATADTILCINAQPILIEKNPDGGILFGIGVNNGQFEASLAGVGIHTVYYRVGEYAACSAIDSLIITVVADSCVLIRPSIFNPNSDFEGLSNFCGMVHQNNTFQLPCLELYPGNRMRIFDRWGRERCDETNYHLNPWDGDGASDGVYFFVLELPNSIMPLKGYFHMVK